MKIKRLGLILLISLICLAILGGIAQASADFFGIWVLEVNKPLEALWEVTRNKNGGVSYRHDRSLADSRIHCWGYIQESDITFSIVNNSKRPIEMNYFTDAYRLITWDKSVYKLKILTSITSYPDVINPGEENGARVSNPLKGRPEDIQYLLISVNYDKVVIFLRRIEEE